MRLKIFNEVKISKVCLPTCFSLNEHIQEIYLLQWMMMQMNRRSRVLNWIIKTNTSYWLMKMVSYCTSTILNKINQIKFHEWFYEIIAHKLCLCCRMRSLNAHISALFFFLNVKLNMASTRRSTTTLPRVWLIDGLLVFVCVSLQVPQVTDGETTVPWLSFWQEWPLASIISTGYVYQ